MSEHDMTETAEAKRHNPIFAHKQNGNGSMDGLGEVGYTKQDCIKWMRKTKQTGVVSFMRKVVVLKGELESDPTHKVKEVPSDDGGQKTSG